MIDPQERWAQYGEKPDYAGLLTFSGTVYSEDPAELRVLDFGDAPVIPADPERSHAAIEATVGQVLAAGALPFVLGGDHSITEPAVRACAIVHGPVGIVHFDTHTD